MSQLRDIGSLVVHVIRLGVGATLLAYSAHTTLAYGESPHFPHRTLYATVLCAATALLSFDSILQIAATTLADVVAAPLDDLVERFAHWLTVAALATAVGHRHLSIRSPAEQGRLYTLYWVIFAALISCDVAACLGTSSLALGSLQSSRGVEDTIMKHLAFGTDIVLDLAIFVMIVSVNKAATKAQFANFDHIFLRPSLRVLCPLLFLQVVSKLAFHITLYTINLNADQRTTFTLVRISTLGALQFAIIAFAIHFSRRQPPPKPRLSVYSIRHSHMFEKSESFADHDTMFTRPRSISPSGVDARDSEDTTTSDTPFIPTPTREVSRDEDISDHHRYSSVNTTTDVDDDGDGVSFDSVSAYSTDAATLRDETRLAWSYDPVPDVPSLPSFIAARASKSNHIDNSVAAP